MATYKVPQDVEAEDKLIGPFSFRQFIYLIIATLSLALAWGLYQIFIVLAIIPLPIALLFGTLALPLRKDQPMEIYLAAIISFYLKPRTRLWDPDGVESLVEITVPKTIEEQLTKNISQDEAEQRFGYLAEIVDSEGWAVRGHGVEAPNTALTEDVYFAAQQAQDVLATDTTVAQSFDHMISQSDTKRRDEAVERMHQQAAAAQAEPAAPVVTAPITDSSSPNPYNFFASQPQPTDQAITQPAAITPEPTMSQAPVYNPYPTIQQTVIQPMNDPAHQVQANAAPVASNTSENTVPAGIMNLANNTDLSIEAIAHEANRIQQKEDELQQEVVISLR